MSDVPLEHGGCKHGYDPECCSQCGPHEHRFTCKVCGTLPPFPEELADANAELELTQEQNASLREAGERLAKSVVERAGFGWGTAVDAALAAWRAAAKETP